MIFDNGIVALQGSASGEPSKIGGVHPFVIPVDPEFVSLDPADRIPFVRPPRNGVNRLDPRSDGDLKQVMFDHESAMERERAIWEYADRHRADVLPLLSEVAQSERDPSLRWSTLWAAQKFSGLECLDLLRKFTLDEHPEVRSWAALLIREITGPTPDLADETRPAKIDESNPFDQTLPLTISGYARVLVPGMGWIEATLSPKWFEAIMGRVMACTRMDTFTSDLVIEKRIKGYHPDGSDHYEIYPFRGHTQQLAPDVYAHYYQSETRHTFYPSGKVEDASEEPLANVIVNIQRGAGSELSILREDPSRRVVRSVRGRYAGAAYINLARVLSNSMQIGPGEVQLSNFHHPQVRSLTNTQLFGTFKGKLSDIDGDGCLDVNTERCHGTLDGELDYDLDGIPDRDPFDYFQ